MVAGLRHQPRDTDASTSACRLLDGLIPPHATAVAAGSLGRCASFRTVERRYQVFISSTFKDLIDERREVMQALLEMDCLPAGMELFPAGNTDQWTLIKGVIEQSDYYLLVLGGRYGSVTEEGISYTEMEYDYVVELGIPVMGFVPADVDAIPVGKTDKDDAAAARLAEFQVKVQRRMTRDWKTAEDLGSKVTRGLVHLIKNHPRPGWVRGDQAMTDEKRTEIAELRARIAELEASEAKADAVRGREATERIDGSYAHGDEKVNVSFVYRGWVESKSVAEYHAYRWTWDEVMFIIGPAMIEEATEHKLVNLIQEQLGSELFNDEEIVTPSNLTVSLDNDSWDSIVVQLRALKAIKSGTRKRLASDHNKYWQLTPAGDQWVTELRADRHESKEAQASA